MAQQSGAAVASGTGAAPSAAEGPTIAPAPAFKPVPKPVKPSGAAAPPPRVAVAAASGAAKPPERTPNTQAPKPPTAPPLTLSDLQEHAERRQHHRSRHVCPQCGSIDTERRRRKMWERVAFVFSDIRAYNCRICGHSFYARRKYKSKSND